MSVIDAIINIKSTIIHFKGKPKNSWFIGHNGIITIIGTNIILNIVNLFGKFLDPIADKILVISAMILLVEDGRLPSYIPIIVLAREFAVSGYRLIAVEKGGTVIAASNWGKLKTVTQMLALILAFLDTNAFGTCFTGTIAGGDFVLNSIVTLLMIIQVIATIFSGYDYLKGSKKLLK